MNTETTTGLHRFANYVGGKDVAPHAGETFDSWNPTVGERWGSFALSQASDVDVAVKTAQQAFRGPWGKLSPTRRGRLLMRWGDRIAAEADTIARTETQQNGKLYAEMHAQARAVLEWLYYFGGLA